MIQRGRLQRNSIQLKCCPPRLAATALQRMMPGSQPLRTAGASAAVLYRRLPMHHTRYTTHPPRSCSEQARKMPSVPPHTTTSYSGAAPSFWPLSRTNWGRGPHTVFVRRSRQATSARFNASYDVAPPAPSAAHGMADTVEDCPSSGWQASGQPKCYNTARQCNGQAGLASKRGAAASAALTRVTHLARQLPGSAPSDGTCAV